MIIQLIGMSKPVAFMLVVGTLILCSYESNAAHLPPPAEFIHEFAYAHNRNFITFYIPKSASFKWLKWHKKSFSM